MTKFFPDEGIIHPRVNFEIDDEIDLQESMKNIVQTIVSVVRPTVHFSVNSIVAEHRDYVKKEHQRFVVIDKYEKALPHISGGYLEDIFCIGPYKLSNDAVILVPASLSQNREIKEKIRSLNGRVKVIEYQDEDDTLAFERWMQEKKKKMVKPVEKNCDIPNLLCFLGDKNYISSYTLMEKSEKTLCTHDITPTFQLESLLTTKLTFFPEAPFVRIDKNLYSDIKNYIKVSEDAFKLSKKQKVFLQIYEKII